MPKKKGKVLQKCQNVSDFKLNDKFDNDMSDENIKTFALIGGTGVGKSSLGNSISGQKETFKVSASLHSVTCESEVKLICWRNSKKCFKLVDNPGLSDSKGRDSAHIAQMVDKFKQLKTIEAFLIVLNGKQPRFDGNIQTMLFLFRNIFGADFINNTAIVITNWGQSKRAKDERQSQKQSEEKICEEINLELKKMGFQPLQELQCFFVDNQINTLSQEKIIEYGAQKELEHLDQEIEKLGRFVQSQKPFICQDIKECLTQNDQLKKQIEDMEAEKQEKDKQQKEEKEQILRKMEEQKNQAEKKLKEQQQQYEEELYQMNIEKDKKIQEQQEKLQNEIQQKQKAIDFHQQCIQNVKKEFQEQKQKNQEEQQKKELLNQKRIRELEEEKEKIKNLNQEKELELNKFIQEIKEDQKNMQNKMLEDQKEQRQKMDSLLQLELQQLKKLENEQEQFEQKKKKLYQKQVQDILQRHPAAGRKFWIFFDTQCRNTFQKYGQLDIKKYNGMYVTTEFDCDETSVKQLEGIQIEWENKKYIVAYQGMVNELNEPHGWGRAIYGDEIGYVDGQWFKGQFHGIIQYVGPYDGYERAFYKYGHLEKSEVKRNW